MLTSQDTALTTHWSVSNCMPNSSISVKRRGICAVHKPWKQSAPSSFSLPPLMKLLHLYPFVQFENERCATVAAHTNADNTPLRMQLSKSIKLSRPIAPTIIDRTCIIKCQQGPTHMQFQNLYNIAMLMLKCSRLGLPNPERQKSWGGS